tara:strand:+ start:121 stop:837 length:717 start_codon:yes stop_codon:yes gene_type:complete
MQNGYIEFGLYILGVYLLILTFRYIKYLNTLYGGKYPLMLFGLSLIYPFFAVSKNSYLTKVTDFFMLTAFFYIVYLIIKLLTAIRNSNGWSSFKEDFQRGQNLANYQIGDSFLKKDTGTQSKKPIFGGAPPPPVRKEKEVSYDNISNKKDPTVSTSQNKEAKSKVNSNGGNMTPISSSVRNCATCAMWGGAREIDTSRIVVRTAGPTVKGKCMGGGHNNMNMTATGTCAKHQKWSSLR